MKKIIYIIIGLILTVTPIFASTAAADTTIISFELIWSTDTYTPFNYQGRNLPVSGSKVTISAIVNTAGDNAKSLKYSWFLEDIFQQNKSGYGKNDFYFYVQQRPGAYHTVRLQVFNDDRTVFEERSIQIPITAPEVVLTRTISAVLADKKFSFVAEPYFFSINKLTDLIFEWTLAGKKPIISSDYDASVFNLTISGKDDTETIESNLLVNVKNSLSEEQTANQSTKINIY